MDTEMLVNLNRILLNSKKHIKKYNHLRKVHGEVLDSMIDYIMEGKYDIDNLFKPLSKNLDKDKTKIELNLDMENPDDATIMCELFIYKVHEDVPSVTEIYLAKNKLRNKEKIEMLNAMNNSFASLFKVVDTDMEEGYVYYEDVFTKKQYKVIDISMSSTYKPDKERPLYMYNRIITIGDISFGTGIHCMLTGDNKKLNNYLKEKKYQNQPNPIRCLTLYTMSKEEKNLETKYNHKYGNNYRQ